MFHKALVRRFNERRSTKITSLIRYLIDPDSLNKPERDQYPFELLSKASAQQFGTELIQSLFEHDESELMVVDENEERTSSADSVDAVEEHEISFQDELKASVGNRWTQAQTESSTMATTIPEIKKCFRDYNERRERGPLLEKLFFALCGIPPTSTQSERNFSLSGQFVSKLRTRLTPVHIDMLSFLKTQFLLQQI